MDYKDSAKLQYRKLVSTMVDDLLRFPHNLSLTAIASELHLTIGQMSRIYHGVCSLSPERFLVLTQLHCNCSKDFTLDLFAASCRISFALPLHGLD